MSLLETFEEMKKEAAQTKEAEVSQDQANEEMEILNKYAEWAEAALIEEKGEGNFTADDVEKLAQDKLEADAEEVMRREKVAELYEAGQIIYQGFKDAAAADAE